MRIRTKIFFGYLILVILGFYFFAKWVRDDIRKNYLESVETGMVDMAYILASVVEGEINNGAIDFEDLAEGFRIVHKKRFAAKIYDVTKTHVNTNVYITNQKGIVLFDSGDSKNVGKDFSSWNDVYITMKGRYGARATRIDPEDATSTILYVSAPIRAHGRVIGVLTVYRSVDFISLFIQLTKQKIMTNALLATGIVFVFGLILSAWLSWPIYKLRNYARSVRDGSNIAMPWLGRGEIRELGDAFEEMREALEGKKYIENYVQHLTHELKSPLSAIKGAIEFLNDENLTEERKVKLLKNINFETGRMQQVVDKMLQLSVLESRRKLEHREKVDLTIIFQELIDNLEENYSALIFTKEISDDEKFVVPGERFLLYQAFDNLIRNAAEFSPDGSAITIRVLRNSQKKIEVQIMDEGTGIPDYALDKIFDRFYSLPRPENSKKSSGLGLSIVKEILDLHESQVMLENRQEGGVIARVIFN